MVPNILSWFKMCSKNGLGYIQVTLIINYTVGRPGKTQVKELLK